MACPEIAMMPTSSGEIGTRARAARQGSRRNASPTTRKSARTETAKPGEGNTSSAIARLRKGACLTVEQRRVGAANVHQLVVRPVFADATIVQHHDPVGVADRGKTMRDQDGRDGVASSPRLIEHRLEEAQL